MSKLLFAGLMILTLQGCASEPDRLSSRFPTNSYCAGIARQRADDADANGVDPPLQQRIFNDVYAICLKDLARRTGSP